MDFVLVEVDGLAAAEVDAAAVPVTFTGLLATLEYPPVERLATGLVSVGKDEVEVEVEGLASFVAARARDGEV